MGTWHEMIKGLLFDRINVFSDQIAINKRIQFSISILSDPAHTPTILIDPAAMGA
jgi:hypothetical protein